ncbi:phosphoserine transaminase [Moritella sp. Urea-trap-13]|uniref:phosphoserine transaminase n=1 Tax=Moritella sp. Urea-trap-13 TaxID=2058327 RepID=UPI000C336566|nr:phosphoserine transaminase [Moritella sp. Urea-trap-13]PKH09135.1 phosphoserine transaminase [Moritella sp. Urea-trap-13]
MIPTSKPHNPNFSSGPCSKRPGYQLEMLDIITMGRSHRSDIGKAALQQAITQTKELLQIPEDYKIAIVPASDTGAMEMMLWSLLGSKPVDVCYWESFGKGWFSDIKNELQLSNVNAITADYGQLPDLNATNSDHDIVFTWNGTTSGVKVENADWISGQRTGLTICDATSAVFAMPMDWDKLDVTTFSWQKVLGGEGAHGMIILSPAAVTRLESYTPPWPLPKIFRLTQNGKLIEGIFSGATINTPSMLCVADYLDALNWITAIGGLDSAIARSENNLAILTNFVNQHDWVDFLAKQVEYRSNTSVCLRLSLTDSQLKKFNNLLAGQQVAYDINSYKDAPSGLRIWCGATVESHDIELLLPWLVWAYESVKDND